MKDPTRRARCEHDLHLFLLTYFPQAFPLPFGDDHLDVIRNIEAAVAEQKIFTLAMPRGSGKTTICEGAGGWIAAKNGIRYTRYDSNYWKTFASRRLASPYPNPGCLVLYGPEGTRHTLLSRHLDSEIRTPTTGKRTVDQWDLRPGESENHWWDNTVANCVLASISGAQMIQTERKQVREEREVKF